MFVRRDIRIDTTGAPIEVQLTCGFAQHVDFDCELFDAQGNNPQLIVRGSNLHSEPPPFTVNIVPSQLIDRFLMISATVQSLGGVNFSLEAVFRQDNRELAKIPADGTFTDQKTVSLVGRFVA